MARIEVVPLPTARRVAAGDDVAALVLGACADAGVSLRDGDVLCVASKVVSKAEGALRPLPVDAGDVHAARRRLAADEGVRIVAETPWVLVVETRHGFVCANAGIDTSNVADGDALLLPEDPDGAAAALRSALRERAGVDVGVVVTDTFGRPWRMGQTDVALGAAGVVALRDDRGTTDLEGRELEVTMVAVADELAAAADLARRKADGTPFVLVRGAGVAGDGTARDLLRDAGEDVFRTGGPTTVEVAVFAPAPVPWHVAADWEPTPAERAAEAARTVAGVVVEDVAEGPPARLRLHADDAVGLGRAVERARLVLEAHGRTVDWDPATDTLTAG